MIYVQRWKLFLSGSGKNFSWVKFQSLAFIFGKIYSYICTTEFFPKLLFFDFDWNLVQRKNSAEKDFRTNLVEHICTAEKLPEFEKIDESFTVEF